MTKPIFIVELPAGTSQQEVEATFSSLDERFNDYYVIVYRGKDEHCNFKAFYEKDFDKVKYEELKNIVQSAANVK